MRSSRLAPKILNNNDQACQDDLLVRPDSHGDNVNIFVLNENPILAARDHCDKHLVKMILESAQMLCAAHWIGWQRMLQPPSGLKQRELQAWLQERVLPDLQPPWKMTHVNHPCTQWTQRAWGNYMWHSRLGLELCAEYERRYKKVHKSLEVHRWLSRRVPPTFEGSTEDPVGITPFAIAMPDDCKVAGDAVQSYRTYYTKNKARIAKWKHSSPPAWWNPSEAI